jgi:subtilisin-like proprotein convertase family protein
MRLGTVTLRRREGGSTDNLRAVFDPVSVPALAACLGRSPKGTWTLSVRDEAAEDEGTLRSFTLKLG